ncbi:MAG: hypothetical protein IJH12_08950 [Clostridia bacterium]|nr:hypothetical protein [Clostridia bacterium]
MIKRFSENVTGGDNNSDTPNRAMYSPMECVKDMALESLYELIKGKMSTCDPSNQLIFKRLLGYVELIQEAAHSYYEVMEIIVDMELNLIEQFGYSYNKSSDGTIDFYESDTSTKSSNTAESEKTPLTEKAYHTIISHLHTDIRENGIPNDVKPAYNRMKAVLSKLVNGETHFGLAMAQARPYLSSIEAMLCITQYYSNMQLLLSLKSMFESYR